MLPRFTNRKISWMIFGTVVLLWGMIFFLERGFTATASEPLKNTVTGHLSRELRVNNFDRRKSTVILLYSKSDSLGIEKLSTSYFRRMQCPVVSCVLTTNRSYFPEMDEFDAIVFSHKKIKDRIGKLPAKRKEKQIYILHEQKPSTAFISDEFQNYFNMTMSFRSNADIQFPSGRIIAKRKNKLVEPGPSAKWMSIPERPKLVSGVLSSIQKKTHLAAWIVPYCPKKGRSMKNHKLIRSLQEHFRVDIAGPCEGSKLKCYSQEDCLEKVERNYKFLVHIEGAFTNDFVSSDTYFLMRYNFIPIIFGTPTYAHYLPPKSHISANTFTTAEELAAVVNKLDGDIIEYAMHFWWKAYYYIQHYPNYCDLCKKTREFRMAARTKYYRNINMWLDPIAFVDPVPPFPDSSSA